MENSTKKITDIENARYHTWFHHQDSDGWITVCKKHKDGSFKQYHYQPNELAAELTNWLGEDVYFSQNTFFKPQRRIENIRQLCSLYVDLDFYLFNYDLSWVMAKLEHEYFKETVPDPNIIIFSGQGLVLIWLLDPVPFQALPLWQAVQNYLLEQLKELGGDSKATDAARVFRLAGSTNSKNGNQVYAEYRHDSKYELRQLQFDYLPDLTEQQNKKKKRGRKKKVVQLFNTYKLHYARLMDLVKLVELRDYDVEGCRETICFLYRYWLCCYTNDPVEALNQTITFNLQFKDPLSIKEVEKATQSANKAWEARNSKEANELAIAKGYPGAGYNLKNATIIKWLEITMEEMAQLETIIDVSEKNRRKRIANMKKRREEGVRKREDYIKEQNDRTKAQLQELKQILNKNSEAKQKEIARIMGISDRHLRRLKKEL